MSQLESDAIRSSAAFFISAQRVLLVLVFRREPAALVNSHELRQCDEARTQLSSHYFLRTRRWRTNHLAEIAIIPRLGFIKTDGHCVCAA